MPERGFHPGADVIQRLGGWLADVLDCVLEGHDRCALLGFPNHNNVGDSAIWLGEKACLERHGIEVSYVCDLYTYRREELEKRLGDGVILLHGGGNLGDIWPVHQEFRERIITSFPGNPIVQLPQSIHFSDRRAKERGAGVFSSHPDLTVLARDERSRGVAEELGARATLCPDMAFAIGPLGVRREPVIDVLWLARTDVEAAGGMQPRDADGVEVTDWLLPPESHPMARKWAAVGVRARQGVNAELARNGPMAPVLRRIVPRTFDALAQRRLKRGCELLARGRTVITDRLHGHILCTLLGIPHVVLDNSYGKIRDFLGPFTGRCGLVRVADSPEEALATARHLVDASSSG